MEAKSVARPLRVEIVFHGQEAGESLPPTRVYLFDRTGKLVRSERVEKGEVSLDVSADQNYRVVVGPDVIGSAKEPPPDLEQQLTQANAVSQDVIPALKQDHVRLALSKYIWYCWWQTCIVVHGTVKKLTNPGSPNPWYLTICSGVVQIFQVDLGCTLDQMASFQVLTLRDLIIERLRGLTLAAEKIQLVKGPIPPGPLAEAKSIGKATGRLRQVTAETHAKTSAAAEKATAEKHVRIPPAKPAMAQAALSHADLVTQLSNLDGLALKQSIIANKSWLWWILCELIPDWAFCWQELGEVPIQSDGSFWAEICFWCPADFPDLYFEVVQNLNGVDTEVYDPQIACTTYYDYDGSQSVDIVVDDPRAVACFPYPPRPTNDLYVWPTAIGNVDLVGITDLEGNPAIINPTTGLLNGTTPWGGSLSLQMSFDPSIIASTQLRYYRWSYMFQGDLSFTQISATVIHRYRQVVSWVPLNFQYPSVVLGPFTVNGTTNLYTIIPDLDPSPGGYGWADVNDPYDRPFGYFDSTGNGLPPFNYNDTLSRRSGVCTLMLEMFDGTGNLVSCGNLGLGGPFMFILPDFAHPGQYTSALTSNNITPQGQLIFRVRIDNNDTVAQLTDVSTPLGSGDPCGMRHYTNGSDLVDVHYAATHPNNYLNWWLNISRGLSGVVASASGNTSSPPMSLPAPSTAGEFKNTASSLLGTCTNAAFAVNLDVDATATDGYSRQFQYDRDATIAFALLNP